MPSITCTRHTLPHGIAYWSNDERYVYLRIVGKDVPFLVIYHDADQSDCEIAIEGIAYRFQI